MQRVLALWLSGHSDKDIAKLLEISRQRVFQIRNALLLEWLLKQYNYSALIKLPLEELREVHKRAHNHDWLNLYQITKLSSISGGTIQAWMKMGWITQSPSQLIRLSEVNTIKKRLIERQCNFLGCTNSINLIHLRAKYCIEHRTN